VAVDTCASLLGRALVDGRQCQYPGELEVKGMGVEYISYPFTLPMPYHLASLLSEVTD
jgi:hypothetical protein